jgi:hypothetical protein
LDEKPSASTEPEHVNGAPEPGDDADSLLPSLPEPDVAATVPPKPALTASAPGDSASEDGEPEDGEHVIDGEEAAAEADTTAETVTPVAAHTEPESDAEPVEEPDDEETVEAPTMPMARATRESEPEPSLSTGGDVGTEEGAQPGGEPADEDPKPARPMQKSIPAWADTAASTTSTAGGAKSHPEAEVAEPSRPMEKATPEWAKTVSGAEAPEAEPEPVSEPRPPVPMAKDGPDWAETGHGAAEATVIPTAEPEAAKAPSWSPGPAETKAPIAADADWPPEPETEHTMPAWTPGQPKRPATSAPAAAADIWPPEPATETAMPAVSPFDSSTGPARPAVAPAKPKEPTRPPEPARQEPVATPAPPPAPVPAPVAPPPAPPPPAPVAPPPAPAVPAYEEPDVDWPAPVDIPAWAPRIRIEAPHAQPVEPAATVAPAAAAPASAAPAAPTPAAPAPTLSPEAAAAETRAAAEALASGQSTPQPVRPATKPGATQAGTGDWRVVPTKPHDVLITGTVPTAEDRAYAEWFAWAKRGGAKAPACHAAAQGAFRALAAGHDIATAVQWATAAMVTPPVAVPVGRQTYCAWFSLANIDLNLETPRAHAYAMAAVAALEAGADARGAHAAGAAAAGVRF